MKKLYLYLASRSKQGIKIISTLQGEQRVASKVQNFEDLKLPPVWNNAVQRIVYENRMLYELWIEEAPSYQHLREQLKARGYRQLPMACTPMLNLGQFHEAPKANTGNCKVVRTMMRKKTDYVTNNLSRSRGLRQLKRR